MMNYATLYIADPSLIGSKILEKYSMVKAYNSKSEGDNAKGMVIELPNATIDCNFMPPEEVPGHLEGFNGFITENLAKGVDLAYVLSRSYYVRMVIGCVISSTVDAEERGLEFITSYAYELKAMLFYNDRLWDYDGECLADLHKESA